MNGPRRDEFTGGMLAEAMHAEVDAVAPPPTLVSGLPARAARRRRAQLTAAGVVASVMLVAGALAVLSTGPVPAPPTGLPTATPSPSESPQPRLTPPPRMEATSLPPGFMYWNTELTETNPGQSGVWPRVVTYARGFTDTGKPRTPIHVMTSVDAIDEVDLGDFDDSSARWVSIGDRRIVRAVDDSGRAGYHWTEQPGINVSVTGARGVTDTELRHVVAAARLVTPQPSTSALARLEPDNGTGVLFGELRGRGSRTIGPIAVPAEFDMHTACDGTALRIRIGSLRDSTRECNDPDSATTEIVDRTSGVRSVTITLTADDSTTWAILVTTSAGHP